MTEPASTMLGKADPQSRDPPFSNFQSALAHKPNLPSSAHDLPCDAELTHWRPLLSNANSAFMHEPMSAHEAPCNDELLNLHPPFKKIESVMPSKPGSAHEPPCSNEVVQDWSMETNKQGFLLKTSGSFPIICETSTAQRGSVDSKGYLDNKHSGTTETGIKALLQDATSRSSRNQMRGTSTGCTSIGLDSTDVEAILHKASRDGRRRRVRVTGTCLTIGLSLVFIGLICWALGGMKRDWLRHLGVVGALLGGIFVLLAVLPSDRRLIYAVSVLSVLVAFSVSIVNLRIFIGQYVKYSEGHCTTDNLKVPCWYQLCKAIFHLIYGIVCFVTSLVVAVVIRRLHPRPMLDFIWRSTSKILTIVALIYFFQIGSKSFVTRALYPGPIFRCGSLLGLSIMIGLPKFRLRSQRWLATRGEGVAASAGVAAAIGSCDPLEVIQLSKASFRYVPYEALTKEDMSTNISNPALNALVCMADFSEVDAFLSHSWHDDAPQKWEALGKWRNRFKRMNNGREPKLWIDKYCINQKEVRANLRCLPCFLAGCKQFLIILGPSYLSRLWCIIEVFVFLTMGGTSDQLEILPLHSGGELEKQQQLEDLFFMISRFDVRRAKCFDKSEKHLLLTIIEAGAGGRIEFNNLVQAALKQAVLDRPRLTKEEPPDILENIS